VYDKHCDVSLIIKSVVLHAKQLTHLVIEEEAQVRPAGSGCGAAQPSKWHGLQNDIPVGFESLPVAVLVSIFNCPATPN
jgi:hypothetical protein